MLTETYALVALSVGQASVRVSLMAFQNYVHANLVNQQSITLDQMEYACDTLNRLYQACHWHKIEQYLIPAIRQATERADDLLDELANVNTAALDIIHSMRQQAGRLAVQTQEQVAQICKKFDDLCAALLLRLEKEERELIAVARSVIQREAWFSIANQFLSYDANLVEIRRTKLQAIAAPELNLGMIPSQSRLFDLEAVNLPFKSQVRVGK